MITPKNNLHAGMSLIEVLMVLAAVSILVFLIGSIPNSIALISKSSRLSLAKEITVKKLEELKKQDYSSLVDESISDDRLKTLPSGVGSVAVSDCDSTICPSHEEIKKVVVSVSWKENGKDQLFKVDALITKGGI